MIHEIGSNQVIVLTGGIGIKMMVKEPNLDEGVPALEWEKLVRVVTRTQIESERLGSNCSEVIFSGEIDETRLCVNEEYSLPLAFLFEGGMASKSKNDKILERAFTTNAFFLEGEVSMVDSKQKARIVLVKMDKEEPAGAHFSTSGYQILDFNR
jgi:hypothetical protein